MQNVGELYYCYIIHTELNILSKLCELEQNIVLFYFGSCSSTQTHLVTIRSFVHNKHRHTHTHGESKNCLRFSSTSADNRQKITKIQQAKECWEKKKLNVSVRVEKINTETHT